MQTDRTLFRVTGEAVSRLVHYCCTVVCRAVLPGLLLAGLVLSGQPLIAHAESPAPVPTSSDESVTESSTESSSEPLSTSRTLPSPLTLDFVLQLDASDHPELRIAQSRVDYSKAMQEVIDARSGLNIFLTADARYIEPAEVAPDQSSNDSRYGLSIRSALYDFGRTGAASDAAQADMQSSEWLLIDAANRHRIRIMSAYFDVLLADLTFIRDNEAMSIGFIRFDRMKMRNELGQHSDIDVLEAEKNYQITRKNRFESRSKQQTTRARLAALLNRPDELSADVSEPGLKYIDNKLPPLEDLLRQAMETSPQLKSLRHQVASAEYRVKSARAGRYPTLKGLLEVFDYERSSSGYHDATASIQLDVPLWQGGAVAAGIARQQADLQQMRARLAQHELGVRQAVLELWHELEVLRIERQEKASLIDYRDLFLDQSRALYEMEVKTELGDSMTQVSDARLQYAQTKFKSALALARLNALSGNPIYPGKEQYQ